VVLALLVAHRLPRAAAPLPLVEGLEVLDLGQRASSA
jgi:hypothetical protein